MKKFNDLHDDAILAVIYYLDGNSVKVAMEVCKKWNRLIGENPSTWRNFKFVVPYDWKQQTAAIKSMMRLVTVIEFRSTKINDPEICDVLQKFNLQFKVLKLNCVVVDPATLRRLIRMFQLVMLTINDTQLRGRRDEDSMTEEMKTLSVHEVSETREISLNLLTFANPSEPSVELLELLTEMKMKTSRLAITTKWNHKYFETFHNQAWIKFIESLVTHENCLKELVIASMAGRKILRELIEPLKRSKIERFAISSGHTTVPDLHVGLEDFIISQPELKQLVICRGGEISQNVINAIHQTKGLRKLRLDDIALPETIKMPNPLENLKTLVVEFNSHSLKSLQPLDELLKMFPHIEKLFVNDDRLYPENRSNEIFLMVQNRLKMLKCVRISVVDEKLVPISIPSIKHLFIRIVENVDRLEQLLAVNPQLEKLSIGSINNSSLNDDKYFELPSSGMNNLHTFIIYSSAPENVEINKKFVLRLKQSCPNLTTVQVDEKTYVPIEKNSFNGLLMCIEHYKSQTDESDFIYVARTSFDVGDWKDIAWNYLQSEIEEQLEEESSSSETSDESEVDDSDESEFEFEYDDGESYTSDDDPGDADF